MDALGAETEGLAAGAFFFEEVTLARSLIPNLEADLTDLADFPAPTQFKKQDKFPSKIKYFYIKLTFYEDTYLTSWQMQRISLENLG